MKILDQRSFVAGLIYLGFGSAIVIASLDIKLGTAQRMGPGFFPLLVGSALLFVGALTMLVAARPGAPTEVLGRWSWRPLIVILGSVVLFALLLRPLGLLMASAVLIAVAPLAQGSYSRSRVLLSLAVLLPLTWAIFITFLGLHIPLLPSFMTGR